MGYLNRDWLEERLARAPGWYLGLYILVNCGLATEEFRSQLPNTSPSARNTR